MKRNLLLLLLLACTSAIAQDIVGDYYWIQFRNKTGTQYSISQPSAYLSQRAISRRQRQGIAIDSIDLPVNATYVAAVKALGFQVKHTSKWLNGCIAILPQNISISNIVFPSYVESYELTKTSSTKSTRTKFETTSAPIDSAYYGYSLQQIGMMNGHILHQQSKGEDVNIAVIDAGFLNANSIATLSSLFTNNQILGTRDFVTPGGNVYTQHYHGTMVLSIIGAKLPGYLIGSAPSASFWLIRSEDANSEFPVEGDYWACAAEFADSVGCEVINSSLGYSTFDNISMNRKYQYMNGKTYRDSRAANIAVDKGIVTVISAGNEGDQSWHYVSTPGEAEKALCVGAVYANGQITSFSSVGFTGSGYPLKPNVVAMGGSTVYASPSGTINAGDGTSFSSPLIAGMAACLVKLYPNEKASEIIKLINESGNNYTSFNTTYGYGLPDFEKILINKSSDVPQILNSSESEIFPNPFKNKLTIINKSEIKEFIIFTIDGREVFRKQLSIGNNTFNFDNSSNLSKGLYFGTLLNGTVTKTFKLIKE